MSHIRKSIIAAIGKRRELGAQNALLWHIPEDMKHFRNSTRGKPVIMGLNTFISLPTALPGRPNIVLTKERGDERAQNAALHPLVTLATSLDEAYAIAEEKARELGVDEFYNIGGASVYAQGLAAAERLYLTCIDAEFPAADVFFPAYEHLFTKVLARHASSDASYCYEFITLEK